MPTDKPTPLLARTWLQSARDDLILAMQGTQLTVPLSLLAFHAQQAAEKALKAVFHHKNLPYERTHDIEVLTTGLKSTGLTIPDVVDDASRLTQHAVQRRYPPASPVTQSEYDEAIHLAQSVLTWAESIIK